MTKCKGSNEDGSICGRHAVYKSEYCKVHQDQDSSVNLCIGKSPAGKPCSRLALEGFLFCRQHRVQIADLEKLQCPRGCGLLTYKLLGNKGGYYVCKECKGSALNAKMMETRLSEHVGTLNELLESGEECSLKCPNCERKMLEFRVAYVIEGGGGGFGGGGIPTGGGGAGIILGIVLIAVVVAAAEASKSKSGVAEYDQTTGETMLIDGCRECGTFWFDGNELSIARQSVSIEGRSPADVARIEARIEAENKAREETRARFTAGGRGRAANTTCLHIDEKNGKKCRRVTFRSTEYCYMHQPKPKFSGDSMPLW